MRKKGKSVEEREWDLGQEVDRDHDSERSFLMWMNPTLLELAIGKTHECREWFGENRSSDRQRRDEIEDLSDMMARPQVAGYGAAFPLGVLRSTRRLAREIWPFYPSLPEVSLRKLSARNEDREASSLCCPAMQQDQVLGVHSRTSFGVRH
jgi:hypothetical protein